MDGDWGLEGLGMRQLGRTTGSFVARVEDVQEAADGGLDYRLHVFTGDSIRELLEGFAFRAGDLTRFDVEITVSRPAVSFDPRAHDLVMPEEGTIARAILEEVQECGELRPTPEWRRAVARRLGCSEKSAYQEVWRLNDEAFLRRKERGVYVAGPVLRAYEELDDVATNRSEPGGLPGNDEERVFK